jgi:hypothetical protein
MKILIIVICIIVILIICAVLVSIDGLHSTHVVLTGGYEVLGVHHNGSQKYWDVIAKKLEGATVIYEGVPYGCCLGPVMAPFRRLALYTKTVFQEDGLEYHNDWILADITYNELLTFYPEKKIDQLARDVDSLKNNSFRLNRFINGFLAFWEVRFGNDELVTRRNTKPVEVAMKYDYRLRKVILFGEAHREGIIREFAKYGITEISREKIFSLE